MEKRLQETILGPKLSVEEYNQELLEAEEAIEKGKGIPHQIVSDEMDREIAKIK